MTSRGVAFALATTVAVACGSFDSADETPSSPAPDGGAEAAPDVMSIPADGPAPATDASSHTFFDDFDDGELGAKWIPGRSSTSPAMLELVTTTSVSAPKAMRAAFTAYDGELLIEAQLAHRFDRSTKSLKCRAMVLVEKHSEAAQPSILNVKFRIPATGTVGNTEVDVAGGGPSTQLSISEDGAGAAQYKSTLSIGTAKWRELALRVDVDSRAIVLTLDGSEIITGMFPAAVRPNEGFDLRFGTFAIGKGDGASWLFDDFWCDVVYD
jgi:hypothetical protein